jgi:hypothetical protein
MIKILLVIGGVWFSLAFLFVFALVAAARKSLPPENVATPAVLPAEATASEKQPFAKPHRRKLWWPIRKTGNGLMPRETWRTGHDAASVSQGAVS